MYIVSLKNERRFLFVCGFKFIFHFFVEQQITISFDKLLKLYFYTAPRRRNGARPVCSVLFMAVFPTLPPPWKLNLPHGLFATLLYYPSTLPQYVSSYTYKRVYVYTNIYNAPLVNASVQKRVNRNPFLIRHHTLRLMWLPYVER